MRIRNARNDLGSVKGLLEVINELLLVALEGFNLRASELLGSGNTLVLDGGQAASEDSLANESDGHAEVEGIDGCPLSGSLLTSNVSNLGDEGLAIVIVVAEDIAGDLNEEGVEHALVPCFEDVGNFCLLKTKATLENVVGLGDELHVTVFDTVVHHLDILKWGSG